VGRMRLQVGPGRRTGLHRLQLNIRSMRRCLYAGSVGRNDDWLRRPDIGGGRVSAGLGGVGPDRRRGKVGEARLDHRLESAGPAGGLATTLASASRARASADFWPRGSFSATLVSVFVRWRGRNAFASFTALRAGCATEASVSCCGAGLCLLTAAAAAGWAGSPRRPPAAPRGGGPARTRGRGRAGG